MARTPEITDAEWQVMEVVWAKAPIGATAVVEALAPETGWQPSTVKTMLARLVKKGCLKVSAPGYRFEYMPRVTRDACLKDASATFLERFFDGAAAPLALHFVRAGELRKEDLDELRRVLDEEECRHG